MEGRDCVWCLGAMRYFGNTLSKLLDLPLYVDTSIPSGTETVHVVGMYDPPLYEMTNRCIRSAKQKVIHWCGSDVQALIGPELLPQAVHVCQSEALRTELTHKGIVAPVVAFPPARRYAHIAKEPWPKDKWVAFYAGTNPVKYGIDMVNALRDVFEPEGVKFFTYAHGSLSEAEYDQMVKDCRAYVRFTKHDGSAVSAREFMEAGRRAVITADLAHASVVRHDDLPGAILALRAALDADGPDMEASAFWAEENSPDTFTKKLAASFFVNGKGWRS